jgi:hypothetical protein
VILVLLALLGSLGTVVLVPLGMFIGSRVMRRRGKPFDFFESWIAGVAPFAAIVIVGLVLAFTMGPLRGASAEFERSMAEARKKPPPQPEFLRQLGVPAQPPAALPPQLESALGMVGMVFGIELMCVVVGTAAWGGTSLLVYGVRGRRPQAADPVPLAAQ